MQLKIEYVDINSIKPYEKNPRHNEEAIPYVMNSIKEFGFKNPIIIDKNNVIIAGHTRLESAKRLGMNEVPIIHADDLNEEQIKAFRLADNKVSEKAEWDIDLLNEELGNFDTIDMGEFGFDIGVFDSDEYGTEFELPEGDKTSLTTITFSFSQEQADYVNEILKKMKGTPEFKDFCYDENNNSNGNALFLIIKQWEEQKK